MWTELTTVEARIDCKPPFSFYFDLVGAYWKTAKAVALPLHRICTLSRKQGATWVVVESALSRQDVREEIEALDNSQGAGGAAEAVQISFINADALPDDLTNLPKNALLGQAILINYRPPKSPDFTHSFIYEAVLSIPTVTDQNGNRAELLNNFVCSDREFQRTVKGAPFSLRGVYYCQQNVETNVCAHACLRMAINSLGACDPPITSNRINTILGMTPPFDGLKLQQVKDVIESVGLTVRITDCSALDRAKFLSTLSATVESGHIALLVFTTASAVEHVVTVFGHTRNSDAWHPQALPAYSGPQSAPFFPSSAWIDHFLIHDDNFGPYYSLSSRALDSDPAVKPHWIIAIHPTLPNTEPTYPEAIASIVLSNGLPSLVNLGNGRWFDYITRGQWQYVLRTILIKKTDYVAHLTTAKGHDQTSLSKADIKLFADLPDLFWMVEFSLPALYTGNRSKLGEVLIDATTPPVNGAANNLILGIRLPSLLLCLDANGQYKRYKLALEAHSAIYQCVAHAQQW